MSAVVDVKRVFPVTSEVLFDAWLNPESIKKWMCPGEGVTVPNPIIDATVGGKFQFDMHMGENVIPHSGEYKIIDRSSKLQFTWISMNTKGEDSIVTLSFKAVGEESCELHLLHELLPSQEAVDDHTGGWNRIFECLNSALG